MAEGAEVEILGTNAGNEKAEFLLPTVINDMVGNGQAKVRMLETDFAWFGVTYQEDKPKTIERVRRMVDDGVYPDRLWS